MKTFQERLHDYAALTVKVGLNVQPGQPLAILGDVGAMPFIHEAVKIGYEVGASNVSVTYTDAYVTRERFMKADANVFKEFPDWLRVEREKWIEKDAAFLFIVSEDPDLLAGAEPQRIADYQKSAGEAMVKWRENDDKNSWVIVAIPSQGWADKVFPEEPNPLDKLWDAIFAATRVNEPNPVQAWKEHVDNLHAKSAYLNNKKYKKLHYKAEGTDLSIELHPKHIWTSGSSKNRFGTPFVANMPTEEVFTTPLRDGINGVVSSKKPLSYAGALIDDFQLTFKDGRIMDVKAKKGEVVLKNLVATDEGSHYIGEVALVPYDSPISNTNILFLNTLFDENASNHLAIGFGFADCIEGGTEMSKEERKAVGINDSVTHVDFMIGCADMDIDGELPDGTREPIFRNGNWAF